MPIAVASTRDAKRDSEIADSLRYYIPEIPSVKRHHVGNEDHG